MENFDTRKWLVRSAWIVYALLCILVVVQIIRALTIFESGFIRGLALFVLLPVATPLLFLSLRPLVRSIWWRCGMIAAVNGLVLLGFALAVPTGETPPGSEVSQVFLSDYKHPRWTLLNVLPEIDQMKLARIYARDLGLVQNRPELLWVEDHLLPIYRTMRERPDYAALGSVMHYTLSETRGEPSWTGHVYRFVPKADPGTKLPVLIAIHGLGGNSKAFLRTWEDFAVANQFIVLCPSFGLGSGERYRSEISQAALEQVREHALVELPGDPERVYLAGFSAGAVGVCAAARTNPTAFKGLIFISPAIDVEALIDRKFVANWGKSPILCITGAQDNWTSWAALRTDARRMDAAGLNVQAVSVKGQDHSLFFAAPEMVFAEIKKWLASTGN